MEALCPHCHQPLVWQQGNLFHCEDCHKTYEEQALCPDCNKPLEKMKACGAVDYFCQHGHGLISKKRITMHYILQD